MNIKFDFSKRFTKAVLEEFSEVIKELQNEIGFKMSSRGWGYILEQSRYINKDQFDKVESAINRCRKEGLLPVDFVAEEAGRLFKNVIEPSNGTIQDTLAWMLRDVLNGSRYYIPDWWDGEDYYIQCVVEKVDLCTLFEPVCLEYKIPIANAKGWQSILQRAEYARRFKQAEEDGKQCVFLYAGDFDCDGLRISDTIRENLRQISEVQWKDGTEGYDPENLIIDRFGLNYDFIKSQGYTWIDNLITGSGLDLSSPSHKNHKLPYVQDYIKQYGVRKCEANAIVTTPKAAQQLMRDAIEEWLGFDALDRFRAKKVAVEEQYETILNTTGLAPIIQATLDGFTNR